MILVPDFVPLRRQTAPTLAILRQPDSRSRTQNRVFYWAWRDSNPRPTDYESVAEIRKCLPDKRLRADRLPLCLFCASGDKFSVCPCNVGGRGGKIKTQGVIRNVRFANPKTPSSASPRPSAGPIRIRGRAVAGRRHGMRPMRLYGPDSAYPVLIPWPRACWGWHWAGSFHFRGGLACLSHWAGVTRNSGVLPELRMDVENIRRKSCGRSDLGRAPGLWL